MLAVSTVVALALVPATWCDAAETNLVKNGDFEGGADRDGYPEDWPRQAGVSLKTEGGNTWLVLTDRGSPGQTIKLDPDWWKLKVTCRMRTTDVVVGDQGWKNARLAMNFVDENRKHVDPWPNVFNASGTTEWTSHEREFPIPAGAVSLIINPAMFGASGTAEYDDIVVVVSRLRSKMKENVPTPAGAGAPGDLSGAHRETSATRERVCLNDLWRFLPLTEEAGEAVPGAKEGWGWCKVPGIWPRSSSGSAQDIQVSGYVEERLEFGKFDQAWYRRTIAVPAAWRGRRVALEFTMLQTHARVFVDGKAAGELYFPGGAVDITERVRPGSTHELAILVTARPFEKESTVFMAPDRALKNRATISNRGITGDLYLESRPAGATVSDVHVVTTTSDMTIAMDTGVSGLERGRYTLAARVYEGDRVVHEFASDEFGPGDLKLGRLAFSSRWKRAKLWDTDAPQNMYRVVVALRDAGGRIVDETLPVRFGFREFRIEGRDFYLNEKRIHLRALNVNNIASAADRASLEGCVRTCERLREYGFNFFITSNYHFKPGAVGYMDGMLEAVDRTGMLMAFSLPHIRDFKVDPKKRESFAAYERLTAWLVRRAQNHPGVIMYAMNHNATGYRGDQNPLRIDGVWSPDGREGQAGWSRDTRAAALVAGEIAGAFDATRPVYHHQSGNLGALHTVNIYLNWAPRQERSDWLEHWGTEGAKPLFFVEWGLPHISSWSSYRGPHFIWRTEAYQQIWDSEFAATYIGQDAYRMTKRKVQSMDYEEKLWARAKPMHWGDLNRHLRMQEENYRSVQAMFADDNWRSHRTWGISAALPWDQGGLWYGSSPGAENEAKYRGLKRPGIVPDRFAGTGDYLYAPDKSGVTPSSLGKSFLRWNMPLCAYIGGGPDHFTDKTHVFAPEETIEKQLVVINDTRHDVTCAWSWNLNGTRYRGRGRSRVGPGDVEMAAVRIPLRGRVEPGTYTLSAAFDFGDGVAQKDAFEVHVIGEAAWPIVRSRVALFDPKGMTAAALSDLGVWPTRVDADADLTGYDLLIIGREALAGEARGPDIMRVDEGLKVLVFEQTYDTLVNRLGLRANVHGMRTAFARVADHPALAGVSDALLRDWRGEATLVEPYLDIDGVEKDNPRWNWLGHNNTRVWRCRNRGCVASVLIEKPSRGNWLPIVDCGFDLQYAPILEYVEGRGRVVFCQLDVTSRTEVDPAAKRIVANLLTYLDGAKPPAYRRVFHVGGQASGEVLKDLGVRHVPYESHTGSGRTLATFVVGPGGIPGATVEYRDAFARGATVIALGLDGAALDRIAPGALRATSKPTVPSFVSDFSSPHLRGISNAELHWKTKLELPALDGAGADHNEALRVVKVGAGTLVACQAAPWMFDCEKKPYLRTTYRRNVFLVSRLVYNAGARGTTGLLMKFGGKPGLYQFTLPASWKGLVDREDVGRDRGWHRSYFDDAAWDPIEVPGSFDTQIPGLEKYDGLFWYRIRFRVPRELRLDELVLHLGGIDDESWIWLNDTFLGEVTKTTNPKDYWSFPRSYEMKPGVLKRDADNVLVVRCLDTYQTGGIRGTPRLSAPGPWVKSYYVQEPEEVDDPYRYYRW